MIHALKISLDFEPLCMQYRLLAVDPCATVPRCRRRSLMSGTLLAYKVVRFDAGFDLVESNSVVGKLIK